MNKPENYSELLQYAQYLGSKHPEDLIQETYLSDLESGNYKEHLGTRLVWLKKIMRNIFLDASKKLVTVSLDLNDIHNQRLVSGQELPAFHSIKPALS